MEALLFVSVLSTGPAAAPTLPTQTHIDSVNLGKSQLLIVRISAGRFWMGTNQTFTQDGGWTNAVEHPAHQVTISKDFWIAQFLVTQRQWQDVMGENPSFFQNAGPDAPVEQVSWNQVQAFLARVNASENRWVVRLPTEAEWEYAARAGTMTETYGPLDDIAWYRANGSRTTHPVGRKLPNAFGLYDMLGNVWQWCQDWFGPYPDASAVDPQGPAQGERRVTRGGCFYCDAVHERAARRNRDVVDHAWRSIGFRIVAVPRTGR